MSVRRWAGIAGIVMAVAGGTVATVRGAAEPEFEAQLELRLDVTRLPPPLRDGPVRVLKGPEVRDLVYRRLGDTPPLRVTAAADDTVLLRSRGPTPEDAVEATNTYAASYLDVRRRQAEADVAVAAGQIQRKIDELESQIRSAAEPQRTFLVRAAGLFETKLDSLQGDLYRPQVVGSTPAKPVHDGARVAWIVAALGATVAIGGAASARRTVPGEVAG